jgi:hypothetical protein
MGESMIFDTVLRLRVKSRLDNHIKGTSHIPRKEVSWYVRERESIKH